MTISLNFDIKDIKQLGNFFLFREQIKGNQNKGMQRKIHIFDYLANRKVFVEFLQERKNPHEKKNHAE